MIMMMLLMMIVLSLGRGCYFFSFITDCFHLFVVYFCGQ